MDHSNRTQEHGPAALSSDTAFTTQQTGRSWPLHIVILRLVTLLVTVTAIFTGLATYVNTRRAANVLADRLTHELTERTRERAADLLGKATHALNENREWTGNDSTYDLGNDSTSDRSAWRARARLFLHVLRANPEFHMVHYGDRYNHFVGASREPGGKLIVTHRWVQTDGRSRWFDYSDVDTLKAAHDRADRFVVTERPWYQAALHTGQLAWSPVYLFAGTRKPGITAALPVTDSAGAVTGVFGIDFELAELDTFVRNLEQEHGYHVYLLTENGRVAAQSAANTGIRPTLSGVGEIDLPVASRSSDPLLRAATTVADFNSANRTSAEALPVFAAKGGRWIGSASDFLLGKGLTWRVVVILPETEILGVVYRNTLLTVGVCLAVLTVAVGVGSYVSIQITRPLRSFADEMCQVSDFVIPSAPLPASPIREVEMMRRALGQMRVSLTSYEKYVPSEVVRLLHAQGRTAQLGGETARLTMLFADVVGFSSLVEQLEPAEAVAALVGYLEVAEAIISHHGGIVDKYVGDAIVAFWGAPIHPREFPERDAVAAALEIQRAMDDLNAHRAADGMPELDVRVGIHTGEALVGNVGSPQRMNYTAIGDAVNVASRIERLNRIYGTQLIASEATFRAIADRVQGRELDVVALKGRRRGVRIFEIVGDESQETFQRLSELYAEGIRLYRAREWREAERLFRQGLEVVPDDVPSRLMADRCAHYAVDPPPSDWDGVYTATAK
jgi:adenylate cyclase